MDFTVRTPQDNDPYSGEASYTVDGSVLTVDDGKGQRVVYGPTAWLRVVGRTPTPAGGWVASL